jgi:hypothetical protein
VMFSAGLSSSNTTSTIGGDQVSTSVSVGLSYDGSSLTPPVISPQTATEAALGGGAAVAGDRFAPEIGDFFRAAWNWFYIGTQNCADDGVCS